MRRLVPDLVVTVAVASAVLSLLALGAASAAADTLSVTPSTGLAASGQSVQISGTYSTGGPVYVVEAAHRGAQTYCNTKAYSTPPAGGPYTLTIFVDGVLNHESALAGRSDDPCPDPTMPGEPVCETGADNSCTIELRRPGTGDVLASAPIAFDFPPPVCSDFTTTTSVNRPVLVSAASRCSDPYKRGFAIEILDGPHHGTLGPPAAYDQRKYTPANRYVGPDQFTIQAAVGGQRSNVATMHIDVRGPDYGGERSRYFFAYWCGRFGRRSFEFGFRPAGGGGGRTPPSFTSAKYPHPFNPLTVADPARPHLSVYSGTSWVAYADTDAFALPGNGKGCKGPAGPLVLHPRIAAPVKTTRANDVACRFKSKFSYVGLFGTRGGGAPPTVRRAVAFEIIVRNGQVKGYRTALIATLAGAHPSLRYDPGRCAR
jgi:hypothetical protein